MAATADTPTAAAPRVLLFGHPGSGKSSLLAALLRAGETQGAVLGAEVIDPTHRLNKLRDHVYRGAEYETAQGQVIGYALRLRPWRVGGRTVPGPTGVLLHDCDGAAAARLLNDPDPLADPEARDAVVQAVVETDAIALVVNAGASDTELIDAFDDFLMFLERVRGRKEFDRDVGGFPVFLVLAQADRLARPGDTTEQWQGRVATRLGYVLDQFEEHLEDDDETPGIQSPYLPFGSVDLRGYAVAVRRPPLADARHPPDEPYGVAEFFRDCFVSAERHQQRVTASDRRLKWTIRSAVLALGMLAAGSAAVLAFKPPPPDPAADLAAAIRAYRNVEEREHPTAAGRLAAGNLRTADRRLRTFLDDPAFDRIPTDLRDYVASRLSEIDAYREYRKKLADAAQQTPADVKTEDELAALEARLTGPLALPPAWAGTDAAGLHDKWLTDLRLIRVAAEGWANWYWARAAEADARAKDTRFPAGWRDDLANFLAHAERPAVGDLLGTDDGMPVEPSTPIPGSVAIAQPRGGPVTFKVPARFDRVYQSRRLWERARDRLVDYADLADALALTPPPPPDSPVAALHGAIAIPPPSAELGRSPAERMQAIDALTELRRATRPDYDPAAAWNVARFEEPARRALMERATRSWVDATERVRGLAGRLLGAKPATATPAQWAAASAALDKEPDLPAWGRLLTLLGAVRDLPPRDRDPVGELRDFLRRDRFELELTGFELRIEKAIPPLTLDRPIEPAGPLEVVVGSDLDRPRVVRRFTLKPRQTTETATVYQAAPDGLGRFEFLRGEQVSVRLPVTVGGPDPNARYAVVWDVTGPAAYRFDGLRAMTSARLLRNSTEQFRTDRIRLTADPGSTLPRLPVLLPSP